MKKNQHKAGYTLIELMLAVAFLASLAVIIAVVVANSAATYRRGLTLKNVNAVGSEIIDDLRNTISNNHVGDLDHACETAYTSNLTRDDCRADGGYSFVSLRRLTTVVVKGSTVKALSHVPVFGAFCTGKYSYVWNSGYFFNNDIYQVNDVHSATFTYRSGGNVKTITNFRLLKIFDETRSVCVAATKNYAPSVTGDPTYYADIDEFDGNFDITDEKALAEDPVDLIGNWINGSNLAIYDLEVARPATTGTGSSILYSGYFILGTVDGGIDIKSDGDYCRSFIDKGIDMEEYCAVNRFNFAIQSSGV